MITDIYNKRILGLAASIPHTERLKDPDASATAFSKMCGSRVVVDLDMEGDLITGFGQDVKACALGQAASSVVGQHIIGSTAGEFRQVANEMRQMLKSDGQPPTGKWKDLEVLEPVRDYKARHTSTLLVFDAVEDAISQIEKS
ncbi:MAG TPA: iron-sulfur cluster assembly scaffold protein [Rhizobiales bacterium]|nr:iron-sulfur cluster assembly scaffold protein [Hyphomicrobiales bacterium]